MLRRIVFVLIFVAYYNEFASGRAFPQNPKPALPASSISPAPVDPKAPSKDPVSASTPIVPPAKGPFATNNIKASSVDLAKSQSVTPSKVSTVAPPVNNAKSQPASKSTTPSPNKPSVHPIHQRESIAKAVTAPPKATQSPSDKPKPKETTAKAITGKPGNKENDLTFKNNPKESVSKAVTPQDLKANNSPSTPATANPPKPGTASDKPVNKPTNDQVKTSSVSPPVIPK